jgi:transposase-like protein
VAKPILSAEHFQNEHAAFEFLEARIWPNGPVCPKCGAGTDRIRKLSGKTTRIGLHKCYACMKPFTVKIGTVFESSHVPLHIWLQTVHLMVSSKKGCSTRQIHRTMGVTLKTAWFMTMRVRETMKTVGIEPMGGACMTVEADETYIGRKSTSRAYEPPAVKQSVFALVERGGAVRSFHVPNVNAANLRPIIAKHAFTDSRFQSDESPIYTRPGKDFAYHGVVNHSAREYVRGDDYTNTIEGYFSIIKRGIYGIYQHVSETHLHRYLSPRGGLCGDKFQRTPDKPQTR